MRSNDDGLLARVCDGVITASVSFIYLIFVSIELNENERYKWYYLFFFYEKLNYLLTAKSHVMKII